MGAGAGNYVMVIAMLRSYCAGAATFPALQPRIRRASSLAPRPPPDHSGTHARITPGLPQASKGVLHARCVPCKCRGLNYSVPGRRLRSGFPDLQIALRIMSPQKEKQPSGSTGRPGGGRGPLIAQPGNDG